MNGFRLGAMYCLGGNSTDEEARQIAHKYGDSVEMLVSKRYRQFGKFHGYSFFLHYGEEIGRVVDFCKHLSRENISFFFFTTWSKDNNFIAYLITDPKFVKICALLLETQKLSIFGNDIKHLNFIRYRVADKDLKDRATKLYRQIEKLREEGVKTFKRCLELAVAGDDTSYRKATKLAAKHKQKLEQILQNDELKTLLKGAILAENI